MFGTASKGELRGVHPRLIDFAQRTLAISPVDFAVHDGLRTASEQREYVRTGVSQTMESLHRVQDDGFGHAVDLVPVINGKKRWEWPPIYEIAAAASIAATDLGLGIRWGGAWIQIQGIQDPTPAKMKALVDAYGARKRAAGKKAFCDGPHFELYP
jgi:peptidoglycan LD-endopeptidase CwlK